MYVILLFLLHFTHSRCLATQVSIRQTKWNYTRTITLFILKVELIREAIHHGNIYVEKNISFLEYYKILC